MELVKDVNKTVHVINAHRTCTSQINNIQTITFTWKLEQKSVGSLNIRWFCWSFFFSRTFEPSSYHFFLFNFCNTYPEGIVFNSLCTWKLNVWVILIWYHCIVMGISSFHAQLKRNKYSIYHVWLNVDLGSHITNVWIKLQLQIYIIVHILMHEILITS